MAVDEEEEGSLETTNFDLFDRFLRFVVETLVGKSAALEARVLLNGAMIEVPVEDRHLALAHRRTDHRCSLRLGALGGLLEAISAH